MAWVRWGDTAANHPIVLKVFEHEEFDDRLVNEVNGFVNRCSQQSGAHDTDYVITRGTAVLIAGASRVDIMLAVAVFAGYMTEIEHDGRQAYKLVDTDSKFLHLRLREEIEWEAQRRLDNSNPSLIVPVRLRDGDGCRWCGRIVDWGSRTAGRSGTYDHLIPGQAATIETYVVCCRSCNSSRKDGTTPRGIETLRDAPDEPYYSTRTLAWLRDNEFRKREGLPVPPRPSKRLNPGDPAPGTEPAATVTPAPAAAPAVAPAPAGDRPDTQSGNEAPPSLDTALAARPVSPAERTDTQSATATSQPRLEHHSGNAPHRPQPAQTPDQSESRGKPADSAGRKGTDPVGTGRDGSGRDGSGRVGRSSLEGDPPTQQVPARRSSRGRRRRKPRT